MLEMFTAAVTNKQAMMILMIILIVFIVLLAVLAIVFIVALRKRAPVIKVVMAPTKADESTAEETAESEEPEDEQPEEVAEPEPAKLEAEEIDDDDGDEPTIVEEGQERVRYVRSFTAKVIQGSNDMKEWYSSLKNELLSYNKVRDRMSWRRETFRLGRATLARFVMRGKTLCLLLAVEPEGYNGTKFAVEDVSNVAATADTPCMYRIKSKRRMQYAKEMIAGVMNAVGVTKQPAFEAKDYFMPYEGTMGLMQRGLVKRVVTNSTRVFKIEEIDKKEAEAAATTVPESEKTDSSGNK